MALAPKPTFDPQVYLTKAAAGRTIVKYETGQVVFSQGDPAAAVFYIQEGKVKVTVVSAKGKEAVVAVMGPDEFCGEARSAWRALFCYWPTSATKAGRSRSSLQSARRRWQR
jgi:CRP/FNR family cyclic AMP-dependent transcriptional regulator